jgi:hypothetical protein
MPIAGRSTQFGLYLIEALFDLLSACHDRSLPDLTKPPILIEVLVPGTTNEPGNEPPPGGTWPLASGVPVAVPGGTVV